MPSNNRTYFPIHALAFAKHGVDWTVLPTGFTAAHGLQSVGHDVNFQLDPVNEIGQIEAYEQIEDIPNVTLTASKVLDGYPLLEHLASQEPGGSSLNSRYNNARANVIAAIYSENNNAASGSPLSVVSLSGMYVQDINFSIPVQGNMTESITLVGNNRVWTTGGGSLTTLFTADSRFNNADTPPGTGGVQRRENVDMLNSRWPTNIAGISSSGTNNYVNGQYLSHIQNVNVSVSLGRTELFELGRRGPYHRYAEFPTRVTCSIEITTSELGDTVNAYEEQDNLTNQQIKIYTACGVVIDLGSSNKLESTSESGGDATGGNKTTTYNFFNLNSLTVTFAGEDYL